MAQQFVKIIAIARMQRDAHRRILRGIASAPALGLANSFHYALCKIICLFGTCDIGLQNHDFVAVEPRQSILVAHPACKLAGHSAQFTLHLRTRLRRPSALQPKIDQMQRKHRLSGTSACDQTMDLLAQNLAIGEVCGSV